MTKLYHGPEGQGWTIPGEQDRKAERVDVPNSPADLAAWLNERAVPPTSAPCNTPSNGSAELDIPEQTEEEIERKLRHYEQHRRQMAAGVCPECGRSAAGILKLAQGNELDTIGNWMETAELWAIERLIERAREIVRARGAVLDGEGRAN